MNPDLEHARHLANCGVPIFVARPNDSKLGFALPRGWQNTVPDPAVVDTWHPGDALCAVMGATVDGCDFDPRHGGVADVRGARAYGVAQTPSGGWHYLVAALGVRSRDGVLGGFDYKAGASDGSGRGFLFIAPTVRISKDTGSPMPYVWEVAPDLDELWMVGGDDTGAELRRLVERGPDSAAVAAEAVPKRWKELSRAEQAWSVRYIDEVLEAWAGRWAEALEWDEGQRDAGGRGWEALARDWAWTCARLAACSWTPWSSEDAEAAYELLVPGAVEEAVGGKWDAGIVGRAGLKSEDEAPWAGLEAERELEKVDVSNSAIAAEWLRHELGGESTPLAGLFRRGDEVIHTPRVDEDGYVPLGGGLDVDGPAQVRPAGAERVQARVQFSYDVLKWVASRKRMEECLFPADAVRVVLGDVQMVPNLRVLRGVTHTPMLRADGSVLWEAGYDVASRRLYLPDGGLTLGAVPDRPMVADVRAARDLLLEMVADFPWNTVHDRANYLCMLLTPLMREMIGPPYKLGIINAHQPGSGKSYLAWILRTLHGGVLRGDVPKDGEEFRKQITSILSTTTAPVVQFDNVRHLEASVLDALLTSDTWSDRVLGSTREVTARNDRSWLATGNNVSLGGDLVRRVLWLTIDPQQPHPENRTDFRIPDLKGWVRGRRGELLRALLVLLRAWVVEGSPVAGTSAGSDDFSAWIDGCRGVLGVAGIDGVVEHADTIQQDSTEDGDDAAGFYEELSSRLGDTVWSAGRVAELGVENGPEGLNTTSSRSVGRWLAARQGRWEGGLCIRHVGYTDHGHVKTWRIQKQFL